MSDEAYYFKFSAEILAVLLQKKTIFDNGRGCVRISISIRMSKNTIKVVALSIIKCLILCPNK